MARRCDLTGKQPSVGNNRPFSLKATRRRFLPNLQKRRIWLPSEQRYITLRISTKGLRTIDKLGIEAVLQKLKSAQTN